MSKFIQTNAVYLEKTNYKPKHLKAVGVDPDKVHLLRFDNLRQLATYVKGIKDIKCSRNSSHKEDSNWSGTKTFDDALDLILYPYKEPPVDIKEKVESIEKKVRNNLHKKGLLTDWLAEDYVYDVEGVEIDIAKLIEGDPECYLKPNKKYKDHFYDLHVNTAVSCTQSVDEIIDAFCKVVAVIVSLERRGHKIRLFASSLSKDVTSARECSLIDVCVKQYDAPVNVKMLARIIYPSFLRRIIFKVEEVEFNGTLVSGYGQAVNGMKGVITIDSSLTEEQLLNDIVAEHVAK